MTNHVRRNSTSDANRIYYDAAGHLSSLTTPRGQTVRRCVLHRATAEQVAPKTVMGFMLWPENPFWFFQFLRLIAEAYFGGADFTECYLAARIRESPALLSGSCIRY
jgi:hypothetical protein